MWVRGMTRRSGSLIPTWRRRAGGRFALWRAGWGRWWNWSTASWSVTARVTNNCVRCSTGRVPGKGFWRSTRRSLRSRLDLWCPTLATGKGRKGGARGSCGKDKEDDAMKPAIFLRIASVLTLIHAVLHTIGGVFSKPGLGADGVAVDE